ncbi:RDD family protein [Williamsia muralis]|uniref:RDD family protein n=1 Tax=Williamsia marianensis TaxID=85044 RepID=A0A495K5J1_WILMA|nr:RDD family protein [Williamsia muralis]RKR95662.1 RDD family protein [Williamsia muralis]
MTSASADFEAIPLGCGRCGTQIPSASARCPECGQQMFVTSGGAVPRSPREAMVAGRIPASNGSRVAAYLVDVAILLAAVAALLAAGLVFGLDAALVVCAAVPAAGWISSAIARANGIRTPGQVLARTTITTGRSGRPIGFWRHLTRTAVLHVSNVLLFAGAISVLIDRGRPRRGCHEKLSGTTTASSVGSAGYEVITAPSAHVAESGKEAADSVTERIDPSTGARTLPLRRAGSGLRLRLDDGSYTDLSGAGYLGVPAVEWSHGRAQIVVTPIEAPTSDDTQVQFSVADGKLWMISTGPDVRSVLDTGESVTAMRPGHPYEVGPGTVVHLGQCSFEVAR